MKLQQALEAAGYAPMRYAGKMVSRPCLGVMLRDSQSLIWLGYELAKAGFERCDVAAAHCDAMRGGIVVYWAKQRFEEPEKESNGQGHSAADEAKHRS